MITWVGIGMIVSETRVGSLRSVLTTPINRKPARYGFSGIVCLVALILLSSSRTHASQQGQLTGSLSSGWYFTDDGAYNRIQSYNSLRASWMIATTSTKHALVRTNLRWRKDWDNSPAAGSQLYIYETYVQCTGLIKRTNLRVGRQYLYSNLGSALVDGGRVQIKMPGKLQFELYGGSQVISSKPDVIRAFTRFGIFGGRLSGKSGGAIQWGIDGFMRKYDGAVSQSAVGIDLSHSHGIIQTFFQTAFDIANRRLALIRGRASVSPQKWHLSGEFIWREPNVRANSIFSVVNIERYKLARIGVRRTLHDALAIDGSAGFSFAKSSTTLYSTLGLSSGIWGIGWRHQSGRGTSSDGAYCFANIDLSRQWALYGNTDLSRYRVQELQESLSDSYTANAGLAFRPGKGFTIETEGQYLRNAVSTSDVRLFLRITKGFTVQKNSAEARP